MSLEECTARIQPSVAQLLLESSSVKSPLPRFSEPKKNKKKNQKKKKKADRYPVTLRRTTDDLESLFGNHAPPISRARVFVSLRTRKAGVAAGNRLR